MLTKVAIQEQIQRIADRRAAKVELSEEFALTRLKWILDCDPRAFFDERGNLKPIGELGEEQAKALASFEVVKENLKSGDGQTEYVHKIKFSDRLKALELLMKKLGMLVERKHIDFGDLPLTLTLNIGEKGSNGNGHKAAGSELHPTVAVREAAPSVLHGRALLTDGSDHEER